MSWGFAAAGTGQRSLSTKLELALPAAPGQEQFSDPGTAAPLPRRRWGSLGKVLVPEQGSRAAEPFGKVCRDEIPPLRPAKPQGEGALAAGHPLTTGSPTLASAGGGDRWALSTMPGAIPTTRSCALSWSKGRCNGSPLDVPGSVPSVPGLRLSQVSAA